MNLTPTIMLCRNEVHDCIEINKRNFVITDFDLIKTYYPKTELQNIVKPRVYVVCMQWSEEKVTRSSVREMELPVQIAVHMKVTPTKTEEIDKLICLVEQLNRVSAKLEGDRFCWLRTEPMQDPNGTPLSFMELHEKHLFQAVFTAFYKAVIC